MNQARRIVLALASIVVLSAARTAPGEDVAALQKQYFAATAPGSWAKYDQTSTDQRGKTTDWEVTLSRLENEDGKVWMEVRRTPKGGSAGKASTFKYLLNPGFKIEKNALNYADSIDRAIMQEDGKSAVEMPWDMMKGLAVGGFGSIDYGSSMALKGSEKIGDRLCDHYLLNGNFEVKVLFVSVKGNYQGDLWLNDAVPFGRVKEASVTHDDSGKLLGKTEWTLVETGSGAKSRITGPVQRARVPGY